MNLYRRVIFQSSKVYLKKCELSVGYHNCRYFNTNKNLYRKIYLERENNYAYNIMESKGYSLSINAQQKDPPTLEEDLSNFLRQNWSRKSSSELITAFHSLSTYCSNQSICISDKMFDDFIDNFTDNVKHLTDKELSEVFFSLDKWPETETIRTRNFIEVWVALDDECLKRMKDWPFDKMLSYISLMYMLNVTKASTFVLKGVQRLTNKYKSLTPPQLVQTLFFIGILRRATMDMHNLEVQLENNISQFTIDELAIMAMGFFKSKTPIRNMSLVSSIIDKVIENSKDIHEISLAALLKVIRYSMKITNDDSIDRLLSVLELEVPRLSVMCCVHIALLGTATLTLHRPCLNKIAKHTLSNLSVARIKDLERLTFTFETFNFTPQTKQPFYELLLDELRKDTRTDEINKYGRSFANCVSYLTMLQIYPTDLINKILDPKFLESTYGKAIYVYGREILTLHNICDIYFKDLKMNRLSPKTVSVLAKKYTDYVPNEDYKRQLNITERMMVDVMNVLRTNRGHDYVKGDHILTHYQRGDIIICNDNNGKPVKVTNNQETNSFGPVQTLPDSNTWIVLIIAGRNSIIRNTQDPTGPFFAKFNDLKSLGYHPALVLWSVWNTLLDVKDKKTYLDELIIKAINS